MHVFQTISQWHKSQTALRIKRFSEENKKRRQSTVCRVRKHNAKRYLWVSTRDLKIPTVLYLTGTNVTKPEAGRRLKDSDTVPPWSRATSVRDSFYIQDEVWIITTTVMFKCCCEEKYTPPCHQLYHQQLLHLEDHATQRLNLVDLNVWNIQVQKDGSHFGIKTWNFRTFPERTMHIISSPIRRFPSSGCSFLVFNSFSW